MSVMRAPLLLTTLLTLSLSFGCSNRNSESPAAHIEHTNEEPTTSTQLSMRVDSDRMGLADRVWVETTWSWVDGTGVLIVSPDWESSNWTLIDTIEVPVSRSGDRYSASHRALIEPFLPGSYLIPSPVLHIESESNDEPFELTVEAFTIEVEGVLPEQDVGELNPIAELTPAAQDDQPSNQRWIWWVAGAGLLALSVLVLVLRSSSIEKQDTIFQQLSRIESDPELDEQAAFEMLDRAFQFLDPRLRQTSEFAEMISECDQARFAEHSDTRATPARLARHALELLGHDSGDTRSGGGA